MGKSTDQSYMRAYYLANAEKLKARAYARYLQEHPLQTFTCIQCGRQFEARKISRRLCSDTCRQERARENGRRQSRRRRAVVAFRYTERDLDKLRRRWRGLCAYCQQSEATEIDHVVPLYRGGTDGIGNLLPACADCNKTKTDKLLVEWRYGRNRPPRS